MYKGQILRAWGKKMVVVVDIPFFETLPDFPTVPKEKADICWLVYQLNDDSKRFELTLSKKVYSGFDDTLKKLGTPEVGSETDFIAELEKKLDKKLSALKAKGFLSYSDFISNNQKNSSIQTVMTEALTLI